MTTSEAVRCPHCGLKFAESMEGGLLTVYCRRCAKTIILDKRVRAPIS